MSDFVTSNISVCINIDYNQVRNFFAGISVAETLLRDTLLGHDEIKPVLRTMLFQMGFNDIEKLADLIVDLVDQ